jgi:hypothetical protein
VFRRKSQEKDGSQGIEVNIQDLIAMLGHNAAEQSVQVFLQSNRLALKPYDDLSGQYSYINLGTGIEIGTEADKSLATIFLHSAGHQGYAAFSGLLPAGLTFSDTRQSARAKLPKPEASGERSDIQYIGPTGAWDRWAMPGYALHITYSLADDRVELVTIMRPDIVPQKPYE